MELKGIIDNLKIIVAMNYSRVIGKDCKIPWHISKDLQRFKALTWGHPIIMGRKTFDSIGRPLDGRKNIIVTRKYGYHPTGVVVCRHIESAVLAATFEKPDAQIWVIGGSEIYKEFLPYARELHITFVQYPLDEGIQFPEVDLDPYEIVSQESTPMEGIAPAHTYFHFRLPEAA